MKKLITLIAIAGFFTHVHAQKVDLKDVPAIVIDAFAKAYPTIKDANWNRDGNNYAVNYTEYKLDKSITWDASGDLIGTNEEIIISALPIVLMVYVKNNYTENIIKGASKDTDAHGTVTYKAELTEMKLFFDSEGKFLKSVYN